MTEDSLFIREFKNRVRSLTGAPCFSCDNSDPHNGGQSVIIFSAESGKYVYKPRPAALDLAVCEFCEALSAMGAPLLPRFLKPTEGIDKACSVLPFIENRQAETERQVEEYYLRCGALLALSELFGSSDLHRENLIAVGSSPVIIDLETLLCGKMPMRGGFDGGLYDALMFCHLLPNWTLEGDKNIDLGALSAAGECQLKYAGAPAHACEHIEEIIRGFEETYLFIINNREEISSLLSLFDSCQFRKLLRPTEVYGKLCDKIKAEKDEEARRRQAERLRRAFELDPDPVWREKMQSVCQSEIDAVLRGDIPYFFSYGSECALRDFKGVVCEDYFELSPVENARRRLGLMCNEDMRSQTRIIAQSLRCTDPSIERLSPASPQEIFGLLENNAIDISPCSFVGLDFDAKGRAFFQSIGFDLYNGLLGILCFYAALYEITGDGTIKSAIETRYADYRRMYIEKSSMIPARQDTVNLTHGLGGHIMALVYISRCLKDESYLNDALTLFKRFDFHGYNSFDFTDVYSGCSGLLLTLPALMGHSIDGKVQAAAKLLADGIRAEMPKLTGFGHGAAGIAAALACAQTVLDEKCYEADILRIIKAENAVFDNEKLNWPDLRNPEVYGFMNGICSGAPGVGIARIITMGQNVGNEISKICMNDIQFIRRYFASIDNPLKRDSLCCGNAARIESEKLLCGDVKYSALNASPALSHGLDTNDFPVGLMQGWSGVGYALCRSIPISASSLFIECTKRTDKREP